MEREVEEAMVVKEGEEQMDEDGRMMMGRKHKFRIMCK
jgi:hypothetical protein